ncbi:MAG TPA: IS110 family transposase [Acidobacteriota bacterium]|nr:IS110 family transposase [Acidobacteriota bacterium]
MMNYSKGIPERTVGLDLGDKRSFVVVLDRDGEEVQRRSLKTGKRAFERFFRRLPPSRVALETGTHAGWASRLLSGLGHEVIVANSRKLRLVYENKRKSDQVDAEYLARLARVDPKLLHPVQVRGPGAQADWTLLEARKQLVEARTDLINHCRGAVKKTGRRLSGCSTPAFSRRAWPEVPEPLREALRPVLETISDLSRRIREMDRLIEVKCEQEYPHTGVLRQIGGVGALTALAFVLRLERAERFAKSRQAGPFLGLIPGRDQSGDWDPGLPISKQGDRMMRCLLVTSAHYILGPFGPDCDLRRKGLGLIERKGGGKNAKKVAVVATARKLAVLMHHLWATGEEYDPFYNAGLQQAA